MQPSRIHSILFISLLTHTATLFALSPANANSADPKFYCGKSNNIPTTLAKTRRGPVAIIHWISTGFGENYQPEQRCKIVSERFQSYYEDDSINYLRAAYLNKQPVICAVKYKGGPCAVLFTLKSGSDPNRTLRQLLNIRDRTTNVVLNESFVTTTEIDMNDFLENAPIESSGEPEATTMTPPANQSQPSTPSSGGKNIW